MALTIAIQDEVLRRFAGVTVAGFLASDLGNARDRLSPQAVAALWVEARRLLETDAATPAAVLGLPEVAAWRAATQRQQLPPAKYRSSVESLIRRCLKGDGINQLQPAVAAYCAVSARYRVPLGAYDLDRLPGGRVEVRELRPTDAFTPIGYQPGQLPANLPVVVYAANGTVLSWAFNHRDSADTCLKPYTGSAVFIGEVIAADGRRSLEQGMAALRELLAGAGVSTGPLLLADAARSEIALTSGNDGVT